VTLQYFTSAKNLLKLLCIKHLAFLINFHILEIFKVLESELFCIVNTTDCIPSVQPNLFFVICLFRKSLAFVLEHRKSLACVLEYLKSLAFVFEQL